MPAIGCQGSQSPVSHSVRTDARTPSHIWTLAIVLSITLRWTNRTRLLRTPYLMLAAASVTFSISRAMVNGLMRTDMCSLLGSAATWLRPAGNASDINT